MPPVSPFPASVKEGWVNLPYSADKNRDSPDMNQASPGAPYFVGVDGAVPGQWVRLVFDEVFWCVGKVGRVDGPALVTVVEIALENGRAPSDFEEWTWRAQIAREGEGWHVTQLVVDRFRGKFEGEPRHLEELDRTLSYWPDHPYALGERSQARLLGGDFKGAIEDLSRLAGDSNRRDRAWILNDRGLAYLQLGDVPAAAAEFRSAVNLQRAAKILRNLAHCEREIGDKKTALALLDEVVALAPRYGRAWYERAELLRDLGRQQSAIESFRQAEKAKFKNVPAAPKAFREPWTAHSRDIGRR